MYNTSKISDIRKELKNGNYTNINKSFSNKINPNKKGLGEIGATGLGIGTIGYGIKKGLDNDFTPSGEFGNHFKNAFSGISENDGGIALSGGTSISSSSNPMSHLGNSFSIQKDKIDFKEKFKNKKRVSF